MNTYLLVSSVLNFLAAAAQIGIILTSMERNHVRNRYLFFLVTLAAWSGTYALWRMSDNAEDAMFFSQMLIGFAALEPVAFFHFCLALSGRKAPKLVATGYAISFLLILAIPFGLIVREVAPLEGHDFWPRAGALMPLYLLHFNGFLAVSLYMLMLGWRSNIGGRASDHMLVLFSALIGFTGGGTNFPLWYEISIQPYGNILVTVYLFLLFHGFYKKRIFGLSINFYKLFVVLALNSSVALFFLLFFGLFRSGIGQPLIFEELWVYGSAAFLVSAVVFSVVPKVKYAAELVIEGALRKERDTPLSELAKFSSDLADIPSEERMFEETAKRLNSVLKVSWVAVYRVDAFGNDYRCVSASGDLGENATSATINLDSPLPRKMLESPDCLLLEQVYSDEQDSYYRQLVELKGDIGLWGVVPIHVSNELPGLILLGPRGRSQSLSGEELSTLFNLGAQIGMNLRIRDFQRRSSEVDKLVALGTMAAGLSHEIRNPLVSVQTLAGVLKSGKSLDMINDEFQQVLVRDVKRIENIVDGVASFSKNQKGAMALNNIQDIVDTTLEICMPVAEAKSVEIEFTGAGDEELLVYSNFDQLVQVFNNLVENAVHALGGIEQGRIAIDIRSKSSPAVGASRWVEISVADNGHGVPQSIIGRVFDPFITSKDTGSREDKHGMGLGLAISKRIIENHDGTISVTNIPGSGAKFLVSLELFDSK